VLHRVPLRRIGDAKALNVSHTRVPHPNGAYHTSPGQARHARRPGLRTQNDFLPFSLFRSGALPAHQTGKGKKGGLGGVSLPRAAASAALPWAGMWLHFQGAVKGLVPEVVMFSTGSLPRVANPRTSRVVYPGVVWLASSSLTSGLSGAGKFKVGGRGGPFTPSAGAAGLGAHLGGNWNRPATIPGTVMSSSNSSQRKA